MHIPRGFLSLGPDHMCKSIVQCVIGWLVGHEFLAEYNGGHTVLFETGAQREFRLATVDVICAWRGTIPSIVISNTAGHATCCTNDNIRAVHGVEVVDWGVRVELVLGCCGNR